ncbi:MAG: response regulator transcription factor [Myxococcales bacterium]|nr:response regulator transcription factor [Myxococcales bacterium]
MHVLVIDDDVRLSSLLTTYLTSQGLTVDTRPDGARGLGAISTQAIARGPVTPGVGVQDALRYDAVILDVMLPDFDGFEVLKRIRAVSDVPVLMLTAKGEPNDRIRGLEGGADDYLGKPFEPRELLARLRAIARRRGPEGTRDGLIVAGNLIIDRFAREARLDDVIVPLTSYQFAILLALAEHAGRVLDREHLMRLARGDDSEAFDRSIDVHVSRIRALIGDDPREPTLIRTVRGAGYVFIARIARTGDERPRGL